MAEPLRQPVPFSEFMHYFFFCGSAWTGMSHEYRYFDDFINLKGDYANIPKSGLFAPAFKRFGQMLLCLVALISLSNVVKERDLLTEEYVMASFPRKVLLMIAVCHLKVFSCYTGFSSMEANFIACG